MIQKNWPFDARADTLSESDITQFFNDEAELLEIHEEELIAAGELEWDLVWGHCLIVFLSIQLCLIELMLVEVVHVDPIQYLVKHDNLINSNHDSIW